MKRTCLISASTLGMVLGLSSVAHADTKPAVLWIPTADVEWTPSGTGDCRLVPRSGDAAAAACVSTPGEEEGPITRAADPDAAAIAEAVTTALAAYQVTVTTDAPPEYLPVYALYPSSTPYELPEGEENTSTNRSYTCVSAPTLCSSNARDAVGLTNGGTLNCTEPNQVQASLYAFGRMAGLEGVSDPTDVMNYPPAYGEEPVVTFTDTCTEVVEPFRTDSDPPEGQQPARGPRVCSLLDRNECEEEFHQNANQYLLAQFGPAAEDTTAPTIEVTSVSDGDVIAAGDELRVDVAVADDSNFVGLRILIESDAFAEFPDNFPLGNASFCTSDICVVNFLDSQPFKPADSEWTTGPLAGLPAGTYSITVEASDYALNEAETITMEVTVEGSDEPGDGEGQGPDGGTPGSTPVDGGNDTFSSMGGEDDGDADPGASGEDDGASDSGCSVAADAGAGGTMAALLALFGLGFARRRG